MIYRCDGYRRFRPNLRRMSGNTAGKITIFETYRSNAIASRRNKIFGLGLRRAMYL
jgi:hypothetical protein